MSRSRRKTPIVGHTTCRSEREDKKLWHQRWRTHERTALASAQTRSQPVRQWRQNSAGPDKHTPAVFAIGR